MRNRVIRLAILAAVSPVISSAASSAQERTLPSSLASAPPYEVPDRLLARRAELALTDVQAGELAALSAEFHSQEKSWHASSKPWIAAARRPSAQQAFDRALATLSSAQRPSAVRALASPEESAP